MLAWLDIVSPGQVVLGVVPVLAGPLQALLAVLPWVLVAVLGLIFSLLRPRVMWGGVKLLWRSKWSLLVLAVLSLTAVRLVQAVRWPAGPEAQRQAEPGADWPMFRGSVTRTGVVDDGREPARAAPVWSWRQAGEAVFSSPAVVGNRVYFSTAASGLGGGRGRIVCLDADSGQLVWQAAPPGYRPTFSSPVVVGQRLLCGEGLHDTRDARVICLDLTPGREGQLLWSHRTASHVECTPVVDGDRVYVGAGDDGFYCLSLEGTADGRGRVLWHRSGSEYPDAETSLVVHGGRVYAGLGWGGQAVCMLDAETGEELRRIATDYPVFSPLAIAASRLFVGMGNGDYVHVAEELRVPPAGAVWCLDLHTLEVLWKFPVGRTVLGAPAVRDGRVYFGSRDGRLYCLDWEGRQLANWNAHAPLLASPAVGPTLVYAVANNGTLFALDRHTLSPLWEFQVSSRPRMFSSPAVARGRVYVGSEHDGLLAVGQADEEEIADSEFWPAPLGSPGSAGAADDWPLPARGAYRGLYAGGAPDAAIGTAAPVVAPPAIAGGELFVALAGDGERRGIACLPLGGDAEAPARWLYSTEQPVVRSPVVSGGTVLAVDGSSGDEGRHLHAIERRTGQLLWQVPVATDAAGTLACTDREVLVQDTPRGLSCLSREGRQMWTEPLGRIEHPPAASDALLVVATADPPTLAVLDLPTGRPLWRQPLSDPPSAGPVVRGATIYLGTSAGLAARSLLDGSPTAGWTVAGPGVSAEFFLDGGVAAYVGDDGRLILLDGTSGRLLGSCPGALPGRAPLASGDRLLFLTADSIRAVAYDHTGFRGSPEVWCELAGQSRPTTSLTAFRGQVFVGIAGRGLVRFGAEE